MDTERKRMKKILAFDLGSSSGRAIEGKYADGKLQYKVW